MKRTSVLLRMAALLMMFLLLLVFVGFQQTTSAKITQERIFQNTTYPPSNTFPTSNGRKISDLLNVSIKSGTYQVFVDNFAFNPATWILTIEGDRITGLSIWRCCPSYRIDPLEGSISGNQVTIERDCRGQGRTDLCRQTYVGTLGTNNIVGRATGTSVNSSWVLYLRPVTNSLTDVIISDSQTEYLSSTGWLSTTITTPAIDWPAVEEAQWVWSKQLLTTEEAQFGTDVITFRRRFSASSAGYASIQISADNAYELLANGVVVGRDGTLDKNGADGDFRSVETYQFQVRAGENEITIRAVSYKDTLGRNDPRANVAGIIFRIVVPKSIYLPLLYR